MPVPSVFQHVATAQELERLTGLKADTLKRRAQRGTVRAVRKGTTWLFWKPDFLGENRLHTARPSRSNAA